MKNNTSALINECFNGKMSIPTFVKLVFSIFKENITDITIMAVLTNIPFLIFKLTIEKGSTLELIANFIAVALSVILTVGIMKLIDSRSKGTDITWIKALLSIKENWMIPAGAILVQNFLIALGAQFFSLFGIIINIMLIASIPLATLGGRNIVTSIIESFNLVKVNFFDVAAKILILSAILGMVMSGIRYLGGANVIVASVGVIAMGVLSTIVTLASMVLFYNLPVVNKNNTF